MNFELTANYKPTGDQPEAIRQLVESINSGEKYNTLLGVTGSGKTFTIANVIAQLNRPAIVLSHNKTLAAQLYGEFKNFFPDNAVEYFVSYYDYYQPEAYLPMSDTYIEKELQINEEIDKLRLRATSALLSGRRDIIVVSSVSCLYGIGNPEDFYSNAIKIKKGGKLSRNKLLYSLIDALYTRNDLDLHKGTFRVKGDTVDIAVAYGDFVYRITFFGNEVEYIESLNLFSNNVFDTPEEITIFPANIFITPKERLHKALMEIEDDMIKQVNHFKVQGKDLEARRLQKRVENDIEIIRELGYCSGIENYSRYFDGRKPDTRPFCLFDYFPENFITVIDESHVTLPQIHAMFGGDRARKKNLVDYGFRLPAAVDNRPLTFEEFENITGQIIYVSATPAKYELEKSQGIIVEQLVRPTGLLDPLIDVRPTQNQIDNLIEEINARVELDERVLVTTLTKRMAEELTNYFEKINIRCRYIHSDVETLERVEIMEGLRRGKFDVLVGVNLLREGLDLPEVSLVAILDADKEGFLRSARSLTQTAGRAARNINGRVIMYADTITESMQQTIDETNRRRERQLKYNEEHNILPRQIQKNNKGIFSNQPLNIEYGAYIEPQNEELVADPVVKYMSKPEIHNAIARAKQQMEDAAKKLNFTEAIRCRDEMYALQKLLNEKFVQK
ncbi:MAG: excinuclease ABC subunit UvrB [Prevotellaceae bacterium]|jgi:excinuclease ABC subunit B|nr:excinuclease ABC subunit UvrB [Prevotellaceae bacterium]